MKPMSQATPDANVEQIIQEFSASMRKHLREHTEGTNVNTGTLLTTDYLNHYSGMVMLMEQLPSTPDELILYLLSWEPITYEEHFKVSGFRDGDLAVTAYRHAPENIRSTFDHIVDRLQSESTKALETVRLQAEAGNTSALAETCASTVPKLRDLIEEASAIVNQHSKSQDAIDAMF